ncbi:MAG: DUF2961 domain-containing protein [Tannerellaceae bacterium]|jgi:hypothetical protein|nr:DUF2961 domain-containing protein [Tannerellaceae bacterium]
MIPLRYKTYLALLPVSLLLCSGCTGSDSGDVTTDKLLTEIASVEENAAYPSVAYKAMTVSGVLSAKEAKSTLLNVLGPGTITRLNLSTDAKKGRLKLLFDESTSGSSIELTSLNLAQAGFPDGFVVGNTSYFPMPFSRSCRIEFERERSDTSSVNYRIDYRAYADSVSVETFSFKRLSPLRKKIAQVTRQLREPTEHRAAQTRQGATILQPGDPISIPLPTGSYAIYELYIRVEPLSGNYAQAMQDMTAQFIFDGLNTARLPLSDFAGSSMEAKAVRNRYIEADESGRITSRWLMPYKEAASIAFINEGKHDKRISYSISLSPITWDERMLYFHASRSEEISEGQDSAIISISGGRGVYKGDAITITNNPTGNPQLILKADGDINTVNAGGQLQDTYCQSEIAMPQSLFGGTGKGIDEENHDYSTFLRLMLLDAVPFTNSMDVIIDRKDENGQMNITATLFWYGDNKARAAHVATPRYQSLALPASSAAE